MNAKKKPKRAPKALSKRSREAKAGELMAMFDAVASDWSNDIENCNDGVYQFMLDLLDWPFTGWSDAAGRAVVLAAAGGAPDEDLEEMLHKARRHLAWLREFHVQVIYEMVTDDCCYSDEAKPTFAAVRALEGAVGRAATRQEIENICASAQKRRAA